MCPTTAWSIPRRSGRRPISGGREWFRFATWAPRSALQRVHDPAGNRDRCAAHGPDLRERHPCGNLPPGACQGRLVNYAGLPDHKDFPLVQKYMDGRASGILSFGVKGGFEGGARFQDALKLVTRLVNIGDAKSLACHPASTTHRQLSADEMTRAGVSPTWSACRSASNISTTSSPIWSRPWLPFEPDVSRRSERPARRIRSWST